MSTTGSSQRQPPQRPQRGRGPPTASQQLNNAANNAQSSRSGSEVLQVHINPHHAAEILATEDNEMDATTQRNHRNRTMEMIKWIKSNYPESYNHMVVELTPAQIANPALKYFSATHDFLYERMNDEVIRAFMSGEKKYKPNSTKQYSEVHVGKYHDAIKFGARTIEAQLPDKYGIAMKKYLNSLKKEKKKAKQTGDLDEEDADPIPFALYEKINTWFLLTGQITHWAFTVMQWNCMARSINIDPLGFHNISKGQDDSIEIKYDLNKKDQTGEKVMPKNCFANPFNHVVCIFVATGTFLCINRSKYRSERDNLFLFGNSKKKSASKNYCKALKNLIAGHEDEVRQFCRIDHFHAHGNRKGSSVLATSGTTCPPPLPSVFHRGEWSLGDVHDVYWQWAAQGDCYLGRILAGLDPDSPDFDVLPPHFIEGMENEYIREGMRLCFGNIIDLYSGSNAIDGFLLLCLGSMVHHSNSLIEVMTQHPGHPFSNIPIFNNPSLLSNLKRLVTTEPAGDVKRPSGIPPHVKQSKVLRAILEQYGTIAKKFDTLKTEIVSAVKGAIDDKVAESGQVTAPMVVELLDKKFDTFKESFTAQIKNTINDAVLSSLRKEPRASVSARSITDDVRRGGAHYHPRLGMYFDIPVGFQFPSGPAANLENSWEYWLKGQPGYRAKDSTGNTVNKPVKPFRHMKPDRIPPGTLRRTYVNWQRIYDMLEVPVKERINSTPINTIKSDFLEETFKLALEHLRSYVSFAFTSPKWKTWSVCTWSKKVTRSYIEEHGTQADKDKLPAKSNRNKSKPSGTRRQRAKQSGVAFFARNASQRTNIGATNASQRTDIDIGTTDRSTSTSAGANAHSGTTASDTAGAAAIRPAAARAATAASTGSAARNTGSAPRNAGTIARNTAAARTSMGAAASTTTRTIASLAAANSAPLDPLQGPTHLPYVLDKRFASVPCECCGSGMMTNHRCRVQDPNGRYTCDDPPILICGKAFCISCAERWGKEGNRNRCGDHLHIAKDDDLVRQQAQANLGRRDVEYDDAAATEFFNDALSDGDNVAATAAASATREGGRRKRRRRLGRGESGLGDGDGNAIGVRHVDTSVAVVPNAGERGFDEALSAAVEEE